MEILDHCYLRKIQYCTVVELFKRLLSPHGINLTEPRREASVLGLTTLRSVPYNDFINFLLIISGMIDIDCTAVTYCTWCTAADVVMKL